MTKDERQQEGEEKFVIAGGKGCLEYCPAFGKTRVAINISKRMRKKNPLLDILVIVPREYLQGQWEEALKEAGLSGPNTRVEIINTAVKTPRTVDFLICDEIHRLAAPTFSLIFERIRYKWILGLTGTIKRLDHKHTILKTYCPVIDKITAVEARDNGWTADYTEFNLGIELAEVELKKYQKMEEDYESYMNRFMWNFGLMKNCALSYKAELKFIPGIGTQYQDSACVKLAKEYGWTGSNSPADAHALFVAKHANPWGGHIADDYHPKKIWLWAINGLRAIRKIKNFVQIHPLKIQRAVELCEAIKVRTITFGESCKGADIITAALKTDAISYHSKVKNMPGMNRKKTLEFIAKEYKNGRYRVANTARALDEGADFPDVQMGVRVAGSSSPTQQQQRRGRIVRLHSTKKSVMVNLYLQGTKEQQWLSKSQGYHADVNWIDSIEELVEEVKL